MLDTWQFGLGEGQPGGSPKLKEKLFSDMQKNPSWGRQICDDYCLAHDYDL